MRLLAPKIVPIALASIVCGIALAGGDKGDHLKMMDTNSDGKVTAAEHDAAAAKMFTKMDVNSDGRVTAAEMDAAHPMMKGKKDADPMARNEDGHDKENAADKAYDKADHRADHKAGKMSSSAKIAAIDTNRDGELTAAEHAAGSKVMFSKMDANSDGTLTAQELRDGHRDMMSASDQ